MVPAVRAMVAWWRIGCNLCAHWIVYFLWNPESTTATMQGEVMVVLILNGTGEKHECRQQHILQIKSTLRDQKGKRAK